jgi:hypothetical protein
MGTLHSEELHNLYLSPNIIRQSKSRRNEVHWVCGKHGRGDKRLKGFDGKVHGKETTRKTEA